MASGETILALPAGTHYKLLDAVAAVDNGAWVDSFKYHAGSIHFVTTGTVSLTVEIRGSNAPTVPAASEHGAQIGSDQVFSSAIETVLSVDNCPRWIKARVSARTNGTVSVYALLRCFA